MTPNQEAHRRLMRLLPLIQEVRTGNLITPAKARALVYVEQEIKSILALLEETMPVPAGASDSEPCPHTETERLSTCCGRPPLNDWEEHRCRQCQENTLWENVCVACQETVPVVPQGGSGDEPVDLALAAAPPQLREGLTADDLRLIKTAATYPRILEAVQSGDLQTMDDVRSALAAANAYTPHAPSDPQGETPYLTPEEVSGFWGSDPQDLANAATDKAIAAFRDRLTPEFLDEVTREAQDGADAQRRILGRVRKEGRA